MGEVLQRILQRVNKKRLARLREDAASLAEEWETFRIRVIEELNNILPPELEFDPKKITIRVLGSGGAIFSGEWTAVKGNLGKFAPLALQYSRFKTFLRSANKWDARVVQSSDDFLMASNELEIGISWVVWCLFEAQARMNSKLRANFAWEATKVVTLFKASMTRFADRPFPFDGSAPVFR